MQSNLKDHVVIEKITDGVAYLIATNKIAEMLLQNNETKQEIEATLSKEYGSPISVSCRFESKEEYFARISGL